jgi:hypothetical protein
MGCRFFRTTHAGRAALDRHLAAIEDSRSPNK